MRFKSSLAILAGAAMLVAACAAPVVTAVPTTAPANGGSQPRTSAPVRPTPTTIVRVVEVGAVPVPTTTPIPPAPTPRPVAPTPTVAPPTPRPSAVPTAPAGPKPIADGTFLVGTDLAPGTYRAPGGDGCYWERLRGFGGTIAEVIANDNARGPVLVTIAPTDAGFTARRCGAFTRVS